MVLPISVLSLFSRVTRASNYPFESITISPFYSSGTISTIIVKSRSGGFKFSALIDNDAYNNTPIVTSTINGAGTYSYSYNNRYTRTTNKLCISITYNGTTNFSTNIEMNMVSPGYKDVNANPEFASTNYIAVLDDSLKWEKRKVNYSFNNFEDYYVPDYFHKFDLTSFNLTIPENQRSFFGCSAKLVVNYQNGVFDNLEGAQNGQVQLPLKSRLLNGKYTFSLEKNIYVHPTTLAVSSEKLDGYVQTRHIYFPRNDMQNQDDYYCYFLFSNFGIDKDSVYHRFHIKALKNIVGDCHNSKYCVQKLYK